MSDWFCFCGRSYAGNRERCECSLPLLSRAEANRLSPVELQRLRDAVIGRARAARHSDDAMWTPRTPWHALSALVEKIDAAIAPRPQTLADYDWPDRLAANLSAAALEELRVRAAERRVRELRESQARARARGIFGRSVK